MMRVLLITLLMFVFSQGIAQIDTSETEIRTIRIGVSKNIDTLPVLPSWAIRADSLPLVQNCTPEGALGTCFYSSLASFITSNQTMLGWTGRAGANISFMIDSTGQIVNIQVLDVVGQSGFQANLVQAIQMLNTQGVIQRPAVQNNKFVNFPCWWMFRYNLDQ